VNIALFGGFDKRPFGPGWKRETIVAVLGGGDIDLTESPPDGEGLLRVVAFLGGVDITVAPGTSVSLSGMSLFGGRSVNVQEGDGPRIKLNAIAIFGGVDVKEQEAGSV
jgi:hypothetical protein